MIRINLYVLAPLWREFRIACLEHGLSASNAVCVLMRLQIQAWAEEKDPKS